MLPQTRQFLLLTTLSVLCLICGVITLFHLIRALPTSSTSLDASIIRKWRNWKEDYSYSDTDYPEFLPIDVGEAALIVSESSLFPLESGNFSFFAWLANIPAGGGFNFEGDQERYFGISMGHQLHCIAALRTSLIEPERYFGDIGHAQHCLNYLRQWILCNPDLTLEPFDPLDRNFAIGVASELYICRDWSAVYKHAKKKMLHHNDLVHQQVVDLEP